MNEFTELGAPGTATAFEPIAVGEQTTVVAAFEPEPASDDGYQSEAALEQAFIDEWSKIGLKVTQRVLILTDHALAPEPCAGQPRHRCE